jgi:hypothetical protein
MLNYYVRLLTAVIGTLCVHCAGGWVIPRSFVDVKGNILICVIAGIGAHLSTT